MVHIPYINQMNTITPTNAQQHFDAVQLHSILQHVSATYIAIFREAQTRIQLQLQQCQNHSTHYTMMHFTTFYLHILNLLLQLPFTCDFIFW